MTLKRCKQRTDLVGNIAGIDLIDCITASPLRRALYIVVLVSEDLLGSKSNLRILGLAELQDSSDLLYDTGSSATELKRGFQYRSLHFSLVLHDWADKVTSIFTPSSGCIAARCRRARQFLASLQASNVAVVRHGTVFHCLTDDWCGTRDYRGMSRSAYLMLQVC